MFPHFSVTLNFYCNESFSVCTYEVDYRKTEDEGNYMPSFIFMSFYFNWKSGWVQIHLNHFLLMSKHDLSTLWVKQNLYD